MFAHENYYQAQYRRQVQQILRPDGKYFTFQMFAHENSYQQIIRYRRQVQQILRPDGTLKISTITAKDYYAYVSVAGRYRHKNDAMSLHWNIELTTRRLCRHFGADWLDDKGRNILQKLVSLATTAYPMGDLIWSTLIREGVSTEGILQSLCQIRANQRKLRVARSYYRSLGVRMCRRLRLDKNYDRSLARSLSCARRRMYRNIANIAMLVVPFEKEITRCFLTACKHNPYLAMRLAFSANIHVVTKTGMNAVSLAVAHGFPILAVQLIDLGVDPFKKNHRGMDAFDFIKKTYFLNKVVESGLRAAVLRRQNRNSTHEILGEFLGDSIVATILMEYVPVQTQNKITCWKLNCWKFGCSCCQCSLKDGASLFNFHYCDPQSDQDRNDRRKYFNRSIWSKVSQEFDGGWECLGEKGGTIYYFQPNGIKNLDPPVDSIDYFPGPILRPSYWWRMLQEKEFVVIQDSVRYKGVLKTPKRWTKEIHWDNGDIWFQGEEPKYTCEYCGRKHHTTLCRLTKHDICYDFSLT